MTILSLIMIANLQPLTNFPLIIYVGMAIEPPSPYEIKSKYLKMKYKDMKTYVNIQREKWETYGCIIMCDGWTGPTKLSIINFMVYSKGSIIFLKSVDASDKIKDNKYI